MLQWRSVFFSIVLSRSSTVLSHFVPLPLSICSGEETEIFLHEILFKLLAPISFTIPRSFPPQIVDFMEAKERGGKVAGRKESRKGGLILTFCSRKGAGADPEGGKQATPPLKKMPPKREQNTPICTKSPKCCTEIAQNALFGG